MILNRARRTGQGLTEYLIVVGMIGILLIPAARRTLQATAGAYTASARRIPTLATPASTTAPSTASSRSSSSATSSGIGGSSSTASPSTTASGAAGSSGALGSIASLTGHHHYGPPAGPLGGGTATPAAAIPTAAAAATPAASPATGSIPVPPTSPLLHHVALAWDKSTSPNVTGYNVYRSSVSGGPFQKVNTAPVGAPSFEDSTVEGGHTYYYVTTAVDAAGVESKYSNEVKTFIPTR